MPDRNWKCIAAAAGTSYASNSYALPNCGMAAAAGSYFCCESKEALHFFPGKEAKKEEKRETVHGRVVFTIKIFC